MCLYQNYGEVCFKTSKPELWRSVLQNFKTRIIGNTWGILFGDATRNSKNDATASSLIIFMFSCTSVANMEGSCTLLSHLFLVCRLCFHTHTHDRIFQWFTIYMSIGFILFNIVTH